MRTARSSGWPAHLAVRLAHSDTNARTTEHDDGTITVSPSILMTSDNPAGAWHGYLERGVWQEV